MSTTLTTAMAVPTVSLFIPGISPVPASISANIYTQDASVNYYTLQCSSGAKDCPFSSNFVLAQGASTATWTLAPESGRSTSVGCALSGSTSAQCTGLTVSAGSTVSTTYATSISYAAVALTSVGNGIKIPSATGTAGNGTAPGNGTTTGKPKSPGTTTGAAGAKSTSKKAAAAPAATGLVGLTGAMAALAVVVGAL